MTTRTSFTPGAGPAHRVLLLALAVAWPAAARAYRPFNSTDAAVAEKGQVEIELGPLGYLVEGRDKALIAPSLILDWGFAGRWEAVLEGRHLVELGGDVREPRQRVEDIALSLKTVVREGSLQEKAGPSVATEMSVLLPTVNGETGAGAEWALVVSRRWPAVTLHSTVAAAWTRAHSPAVLGAAIIEGHDAWAVRPVAEVLVERERDSPATVSGLFGTIWRAADALSLDAAVRLARSGGVNATEIRLGLTWGFGVGFPRSTGPP